MCSGNAYLAFETLFRSLVLHGHGVFAGDEQAPALSAYRGTAKRFKIVQAAAEAITNHSRSLLSNRRRREGCNGKGYST